MADKFYVIGALVLDTYEAARTPDKPTVKKLTLMRLSNENMDKLIDLEAIIKEEESTLRRKEELKVLYGQRKELWNTHYEEYLVIGGSYKTGQILDSLPEGAVPFVR